MTDVWSNWSGWVKAWPQNLAAPASEEEVVEVIKTAPAPIRVAGRGHSFTPLVESNGTLMTLWGLAGVIDHDETAQTARIKAGTTIRDLGPELFERGLALVNQGDIDRQALAGAVAGHAWPGGTLGSVSCGNPLPPCDGERRDSDLQCEREFGCFDAGA